MRGPGNDHVQGTNGDDVIFTGKGKDTVAAGNGEDLVCSGNGNDTVDTGNDDDKLDGGEGDDELHGYNDGDKIIGGDGDDFLDGRRGEVGDNLIGGDGRRPPARRREALRRATATTCSTATATRTTPSSDRIYGGDGDDRIEGDFGGNAGRRASTPATATTSVRGADDDDAIRGGDGDDELDGGSGDDDLFGEAGRRLSSTAATGSDAIDGEPRHRHLQRDGRTRSCSAVTRGLRMEGSDARQDAFELDPVDRALAQDRPVAAGCRSRSGRPRSRACRRARRRRSRGRRRR